MSFISSHKGGFNGDQIHNNFVNFITCMRECYEKKIRPTMQMIHTPDAIQEQFEQAQKSKSAQLSATKIVLVAPPLYFTMKEVEDLAKGFKSGKLKIDYGFNGSEAIWEGSTLGLALKPPLANCFNPARRFRGLPLAIVLGIFPSACL